MLDRSRSHHLRGLVVGRNVYWWDGHDAIHGDLAELLGNREYIDDRLDLRLRNGLPAIDSDETTYQRWKSHPVMGKLFQSPALYFFGGSHGWLAGPEWLALMQM
jgi:hypothetical protein